MSSLYSRVLVAVVGLPVVLGAVYVGGWWLFALLTCAALIAVHEFVTMARTLRPLAPAVYVGTVLALLGAQKGGVTWMLAGFLSCFLLSFALSAVASTRASATAAIGVTVLGAAWIGLGLGHPVAAAAHARRAAADRVHGAADRVRGRHVRLFRRPADRPAQARADALAGQDVGGLRHRLARRNLRRLRRPLLGSGPLPRDLEAIVLGPSSSSRPPRATSSSRC